MEEISKLLKASNMSLDQSQAKRIPLNATRYPSSGSKACMFDNLGATPYTSPTKPGTKGKERAASSSQGELHGKRRRAQTTSRSKSRPADESDDDLLLTEGSAHGSPSKVTPLSDLDGDSDAELMKDTKSGLSKRSTLPMRGKETRRAKSSPKHPESVKSPNSLDIAKRHATQKMKLGAGVNRKGRRPDFKVQCPSTTLEVSSALPKEVSKTISASRVDPLSQLLKEKEDFQTKEECTPKPIARIQSVLASKARSNPSKEATRAASASRINPLAELLKEKKDCICKEDNISQHKTRSKPDAKGKGKATSLQPFPMDSPPLTRTTKKGANESDDADPLQMNDTDEITTRGGLRPFPMSSQDFEGMKKASKPSSDASSSSSKRGSSPHPDEWAAKRRRKTNGMLEDYEFADISMTQFEQRADPKTLCPFCDQPMPDSPSPLLQDMLDHLKRTSYPDPRPTNSLGRRAPLLNYISLCQRHQFETKILPKARAKGWPSNIDFEALPGRVARLKNQLHDIVQDKEKSIVWKALKKEIERKGIRRVMGLAGQFEGFKRCQPGYYGEQGAVIIYQALYILFPNVALEFSATAPLSYTEFVQCVLVPEVAASLVQEDMGLETRAEALQVLEDSSSYGVAMFPDNENEEDGLESRRTNVGERMIREHVKLRRKEVDDEDLLDGLELSKPAKAKKVKRKPTRSNNADDLGLFSSDSTTTQSETSHRKTKNSEKSSKAIKVTSSPDGKENMQRHSSSSQTLVSVIAEGKSRLKYAIHTRPDFLEDLDATPRPIPPSKNNQATKPNTDTNRMKKPKGQVLDFEPTTKLKLTGLSNPLQLARSRKAQGVLSSQSSTKCRYNMANESSDDDAEGPPSSSFPQRSQTTSLTTAAKSSKRPPSDFERKDSQWLLSDGPTPDTTPRP